MYDLLISNIKKMKIEQHMKGNKIIIMVEIREVRY